MLKTRVPKCPILKRLLSPFSWKVVRLWSNFISATKQVRLKGFLLKYIPMIGDQQAQGLRPGWLTAEVLSPGWFTQFPLPPDPGTQRDYSHQFRSLGVCRGTRVQQIETLLRILEGIEDPQSHTWCPFLDQQEELRKPEKIASQHHTALALPLKE